MSIGFIYVLANSSMPGLVKVGKTERTPLERAEELAKTTGVPTPFIVVYEQLFKDCDSAEVFIHTLLTQQGYRVSKNREFFNCPTTEAVKAIITASQAEISNNPCEELRNTQLQDREPWRHLFNQAIDALDGIGNELEDPLKALNLFKKSAQLGCTYAYGYLGDIYFDGKPGVPENRNKGVEYYKIGSENLDEYCLLRMAQYFLNIGHIENYKKTLLKIKYHLSQDNEPLIEINECNTQHRFLMKLIPLIDTLTRAGLNIEESLRPTIRKNRDWLLTQVSEILAESKKSNASISTIARIQTIKIIIKKA